jgi:hypothetical protein
MRIAAVFCLMLALALPAAAAPTPAIDPTEAPPAAVPELPPAGPGVIELFRGFGLFGTFAPDCNRPAAPNNPHVSVTQEQGGLVIETHDVGGDYATNIYGVRAARKLGAARLQIYVVFVPGTQAEEFQTLELMVGKGTRRTMFNRVDDGPVRVRRGIALALGSKTPLLKRCS